VSGDLDRTARTYAAAADHYDGPTLGFWRRYGRQTVARLGLRPGDRVFDACCGSGESALAAAEAVGPDGDVLGVDVAAPMLDLATAKAAAAGLRNVEFYQGDAARTGWRDGGFDAVVCVFGVFFAADPASFVAELWRRVAPGGVLAVTTWGPRLFEPGDHVFWDAVGAEDPGLYKGFNPWDAITTPAALADLLRAGGVPAPAAEAVDGRHPLASPDDFWHIVNGTGYRGTLDALSPESQARVRDRVIRDMRALAVTAVETNVVYGTARRSAP
jgi:SAM-dependent methyltransferase